MGGTGAPCGRHVAAGPDLRGRRPRGARAGPAGRAVTGAPSATRLLLHVPFQTDAQVYNTSYTIS